MRPFIPPPPMKRPAFCRYCGNSKADHAQSWSRCYGYAAPYKPTCRVCGSGFDPDKSGRSDCCYRHRLDS